ncbi:MAG: site-specific integrase [Candidatus Micrarchaeota archaeon]
MEISNFQNNKPTRKEIKQLWPEAKEMLKYFGRYLPKQRLIKALEILSDARKRRFLRCRIPKYGTLNKGFTEEELIRFLNSIEDPKMLLLFTYQAVLGLRVGEVVKLHIKDINLQTCELKIDNQKGGRADCLPIPARLFDQTIRLINDYENAIFKAKGYLFWAENYPDSNPCPYISKNFVRNIFRKTIQKLKLDETYGLSDGQTLKLLHRLTTHSLRHYAITNFSKKNNGNVVLTSKFARHHRIETTMTYIHTGKEELYRSITIAQEDGVLEKVKRMQEGIC